MKRLAAALVILLLASATAPAQVGLWRLRVDRFSGETTLTYGGQVVLQDLRLEVESEAGRRPVRLWDAESNDRNRFSATAEGGFRFEIVVSGDAEQGVEESLRIEAVRPSDGSIQGVQVYLTSRISFGVDPIPVRLAPSDGEIVQMSLGGAFSARCDAIFDRARDQAIWFDGSLSLEEKAVLMLRSSGLLRDGSAQLLEIRYFPQTLARRFGVNGFRGGNAAEADPPWGWNGRAHALNEDEVFRNARWLSENLGVLGQSSIWIGGDSAADAVSDSFFNGGNLEGNDSFRRGLRWLSDQIRRLGLRPGIEIDPHAQAPSNVEGAEYDLLVRDASRKPVLLDGTEDALLDPTSRHADDFLDTLMEHILVVLRFDDVSLLRQKAVVNAYESHQAKFSGSYRSVEEAYRSTLQRIRSHLGEKGRLFDRDGRTFAGIGLFDASRQERRDTFGWAGFLKALRDTLSGYFLHNVAWFSDPGLFSVAPPLDLEQARAWATLLAITGQVAVCGDRLTELSRDRVEVLRTIMPPQQIRPIELYPIGGAPSVWNLRIQGSHGEWDVIALFNWSDEAKLMSVDFADLGWNEPQAPRHAYEFWERHYIGEVRGRIDMTVPATGVRVFSVRRAENLPMIVGATRHLVPGFPENLEIKWDPDLGVLMGAFVPVPNQEYEVSIALGSGDVRWILNRVQARGAAPFFNESIGLITIRFGANPRPPERSTFRLHVHPVPRDVDNVQAPAPLVGTLLSGQVVLRWRSVPGARLYEIRRNGERLGRITGNVFVDRSLPESESIDYEVATVDVIGRLSSPARWSTSTHPE